jgi:DedD protein
MGLFSFLSKNKQASTAEDSGYYSGADEQALNARARSKRASSASEADESGAPRRAGRSAADDPVLPEKKRARRRLVGAIGLALAVAIGLPMILDSEPKPLASDIEIRIPSKAQGVSMPAPAPAPGLGAGMDESEQVIAAPRPSPVLPSIVMPATDASPQPAPVPLPAPKVEAPAPEPKPVARIEPKPPQETKPEVKPEVKLEAKPPAKAVDSTRALAILEGRPVAKAEVNYVVQVAALATQDKVDELQERLKAAGIASYTQKISTAAGQRIRVRVGPFSSREEADKALAKLAKLGLNGSLVPA